MFSGDYNTYIISFNELSGWYVLQLDCASDVSTGQRACVRGSQCQTLSLVASSGSQFVSTLQFYIHHINSTLLKYLLVT